MFHLVHEISQHDLMDSSTSAGTFARGEASATRKTEGSRTDVKGSGRLTRANSQKRWFWGFSDGYPFFSVYLRALRYTEDVIDNRLVFVMELSL